MGRFRWLLCAAFAAVALLAGLLVPGQDRAHAAPAPFLCSGADWNGLHNPPNTWREVRAGRVSLPGGPGVAVRGGDGVVDWAVDPFGSSGWRKWFLSLKWVGSLVIRASGRSDVVRGIPVRPTPLERREAVDAAVAYVRDYVSNVPLGRFGNVEAAHAHHRVHAMACLLDAWHRVYAALGLPAPDSAWLRVALAQQARHVQRSYRGAWNQGLDDAQAVMLAGCVAGDPALLGWASGRFAELAQSTMDMDGVTSEQSVGYSQYLWSRWRLVSARARSCGFVLPSALRARVDRVAEFVVMATRPDGRFAQIGDTYANPRNYTPQPRGQADLPLARAYPGGWVFVRSDWSPSATYLTMRFGPARRYHGHFDHTSLTMFARGHEVISDSGHVGYDHSGRRRYIWSPEAHSVVTVKAPWIRRPDSRSAAVLRSFARTSTGARIRVTDRAYPGVVRDRSVELRSDLNALLTVDRLTALRAGGVSYAQRWVLPDGWRVDRTGSATMVAAKGPERITLLRVPLADQGGRAGARGPFGPDGVKVTSGIVGIDPGDVRRSNHVLFTDATPTTAFVTLVVAHAAGTPVSARASAGAGSACVVVAVGARSATMCA